MKFKDIDTIVNARRKFEQANLKLEKSFCISNATIYYNGHYSTELGMNDELVSVLREASVKFYIASCELALQELENLNVDVSTEKQSLKVVGL